MHQVIYLEPDEEITSVIDKINQAEGDSLALVIPKGAVVLQSLVNLKLLKKEAETLGKEISLVTADKIGRNLASQAALTVYDDLKEPRVITPPRTEAPSMKDEIVDLSEKEEDDRELHIHHFQDDQTENVKKDELPIEEKHQPVEIAKHPSTEPKVSFDQQGQVKEKITFPQLPSTNHSKTGMNRRHGEPKARLKYILPFIVFIFILLGFLLYLLYPKAIITLGVKSDPWSTSLELLLDPKIKKVNQKTNSFPGKIISIEKEQSKKYNSSGTKNIGEKAKGQATFYNLWDSNPQSFKAGTKLALSGKIFILTQDITIPGSTIHQGNPVAGTTNGNLEAENPGEEYNLGPGKLTIQGLEAAKQDKIYGQTNSAFSGGLTKQVKVVSAKDIDQAQKELSQILFDEAKGELTNQTKDLKTIAETQEEEILQAKSSQSANQEAESFEMKVKVRVRVFTYNETDFRNLLNLLVQTKLPADKVLRLQPTDQINTTVLEKNYDRETAKLKVDLTTRISDQLDTKNLIGKVLGKGKAEAPEILLQNPAIKNVEINLRPSWWLKKIPTLEKNVEIKVEYLD